MDDFQSARPAGLANSGPPDHRELARAHLQGLAAHLKDFAFRASAQPICPSPQDILHVLRAILLTGPKKRFNGKLRAMCVQIWSDEFCALWGKREVRAGGFWREETFYELLRAKNEPPDQSWDLLHARLARECLLALELLQTAPSALLAAAHVSASDLTEVLDAVFDFAGGQRVSLTPMIDTALSMAPYWDGPKWKRDSSPEPKRVAADVVERLGRRARRIIYLQGTSFSAKRDVLKGVVRMIGGGGYLALANGRRLPIFAQAVGAVTSTLFVDRVFKFFNAFGYADELRAHLTTEGKIAVIAAAAKREPVLFIVADVEPFDQDAIVRRLRGDRIGDVLECVVNGHPESRILIGMNLSAKAPPQRVPWMNHAEFIRLKPSREEFAMAIEATGTQLRRELASIKNLSGATMRLALPIIERASGKNELPANHSSFMFALRQDDPKSIFLFVWNTLAPTDQLLLGLIAGSHDGFRLETMLRMLKAMAADPLTEESVLHAPSSFEQLRAWQLANDNLVRWRQETEDDGEKPTHGAFYVREPIRSLVLEVWVTQSAPVARFAYWCIAREAAAQAKEALLVEQKERALALNLQTLHALVASVDPSQIADVAMLTQRSTLHFASRVLPPLAQPAKKPTAHAALRYAWSQLYKMDIEGGGHELHNDHDDPFARLDALLPFLNPQTPWKSGISRSLCSADGSLPTLHSLGPVARVFAPNEQLEYLTRVALAALRVGNFHMVRDAAHLGRLLRESHKDTLPKRDALRLLRAEVDLGILYGGNPDAKMGQVFCGRGTARTYPPRHLTLDGVAERIHALLRELVPVSANPVKSADDLFIEGKLFERLGEVEHLRGDRRKAIGAFLTAVRAEAELSRRGPLGAAMPTILGGRGARRLARYCLSRSLSRQFTTIGFPSDGLAWPTPMVLKEKSASLRYARAQIDLNRVRIGRGHAADQLAAMIDDVRLSMAIGQFDNADRQIDAAIQAAGRGDSGYELLLELGMLRAVLAVENAMRLPDAWCPERNAAALQTLQTAISLVRNAYESFCTLAKDQCLDPYESVTYLVWAQFSLLVSRAEPPGSPERATQVKEARVVFEYARRRMADVCHRLHIPRIDATLAAIDALKG